MYKKIIALFLFSLNTYAQVGIGTTAPDGALDITSTNDGLLIPRVALTGSGDVLTIPLRTTSELVYNTATVSDVTPGYYYWNGGSWLKLAASAGSNWATTGNAATVPGTWAAPGTNFIGTTDNTDVFLRSNNINAIRLTTAGNVEMGATAPIEAKLYVENKSNTAYLGIYNRYAPTTLASGASVSFQTENNISNAAYTGTKQGIWSEISAPGTGTKIGSVNIVRTTAGTASGNLYGITNTLHINNNSTAIFTRNNFGLSNNFNFNANARGTIFGVNNTVNGVANAANVEEVIGFRNNFIIGSNGPIYGASTLYVSSAMANATTGNKYGYHVIIPAANVGGTHYGIYSDVTKAGSYSGFFLGSVAIGTSVANTYKFPASRGTNGQVMITDGAGNLSWGNASLIAPIIVVSDENQDATSRNSGIFNATTENQTIRITSEDITTIKLPKASENQNKTYRIILKNGLSPKTIIAEGGEIIDDALALPSTFSQITSSYKYVIQSDGTDWILIGK